MSTELKGLLEQTNIQHAIVGEPNASLRDILGGLTKTKLASLAKVYTIPGRSKMKQQELAAAVLERVSDPGQMESTLLVLDPAEWAVFDNVYANRVMQDNYVPYGHYHFMLERGLVFSYFHEGKFMLVMPDEVREAFSQVNSERFQEIRGKYALVYDYLLALTNLYGMFTQDKLLEIINEQNASTPLHEEELNDCLERLLQREQKFVRHDGYLADTSLVHFAEAGEFEALLKQAEGKPYFVPEKKELLKYADDGYFEMTPQLTTLKSYVLNHLCREKEPVDDLIDDIQLACSMEAPMQKIVGEFERRDITFDSMDQVQRITVLIADVMNHTRMWSRRGHTPAELGEEVATESNPVLAATKTPIRVDKVGRNEPCPCGSGQKYKKCCGK